MAMTPAGKKAEKPIPSRPLYGLYGMPCLLVYKVYEISLSREKIVA
jgi:hypothetical protein